MKTDYTSFIAHNGEGKYQCLACGCHWTDRGKLLWWPITIKFFPRAWSFGRHFIRSLEYLGPAKYISEQVIRIGPIRVILGRGWESPIFYNKHKGLWLRRQGQGWLESFSEWL